MERIDRKGIQRERFVYGGILLRNHKIVQSSHPSPFNSNSQPLSLQILSKDMFIIRGYNKETDGQFLPTEQSDHQICFKYCGTDEDNAPNSYSVGMKRAGS